MVLLEIVVLANSKKNRIIKAYDVNLISMTRRTDFCFKNVCKYVFVLHIDRRFVTLWKRTFPWTPPIPRKLLPFDPPPPHPLRISSDFPFGGAGMDIFWNHTIKRDDGSGWKWIRVDKSEWKWMKVDRWMKVNESGWRWMTLNEDGWRWIIVNESETLI